MKCCVCPVYWRPTTVAAPSPLYIFNHSMVSPCSSNHHSPAPSRISSHHAPSPCASRRSSLLLLTGGWEAILWYSQSLSSSSSWKLWLMLCKATRPAAVSQQRKLNENGSDGKTWSWIFLQQPQLRLLLLLLHCSSTQSPSRSVVAVLLCHVWFLCVNAPRVLLSSAHKSS